MKKPMPSDLIGVYAEIAEIIGVDNAFLIYQNLHGQQFVFPQRFFKPEYVAANVQKEHLTSTCRELAKKYGYSERRIRQMIKK